VDEVPFRPVCEALSFNFIIWYCPKLEVLREWFSPVRIRVGRVDNSCYLFLGLLAWFDMSGRGSWVYIRIGVRPSLPSEVPSAGCGLSSHGEISGMCTRISSFSQMDGLNKYCVNMPGGGGSRLDPSPARASAASLSRQRIWWSSKPSNFSSNFLISCLYASMWESTI
jgi:hypothetical protein